MAAKEGKKRAMAAAAKKGYGNYKNTTDPSLAFSDPMKANAALSESVLKSGGSQSDIDEANEMARADMMRGLQAVGKYAYGGKVC
jgi:regulator of sigma D